MMLLYAALSDFIKEKGYKNGFCDVADSLQQYPVSR